MVFPGLVYTVFEGATDFILLKTNDFIFVLWKNLTIFYKYIFFLFELVDKREIIAKFR